MCVFIKAQTPYYFYKSQTQKVYFSLNTEYAFISLNEPYLPVEIEQFATKTIEFQDDYSNSKQYQGKHGTSRFWTELHFNEKLSDEQYLALFDYVKSMHEDIIISPYFKYEKKAKIGLSNFFYVKLKDETDTVLLRQMAEQTACIIIEQDPYLPLWFVLSITSSSIYNAMEMANLFNESGAFNCSMPDIMFGNTLACSIDPYFDNQWGLKNTGQEYIVYNEEMDFTTYQATAGIDIKVCQAWQISTGSGVVVAVIDDGVQLDHPDLAANIYPLSYDSETNTSPSQVRWCHGTAVAGIIAAEGNNDEGIVGVAPNSHIISISTTLSVNPVNPIQSIPKYVRAITWAANNGADIINNSWGDDLLTSEYITDAIDFALISGRGGLGCVIVCSAQNYNTDVTFPAKLPQVIAVGAISPCGERLSDTSCDGQDLGSNYGESLDIVAPGVFISTTNRQHFQSYNPSQFIPNDYTDTLYTKFFWGTSAAAPHVAGVAALVLSVNPNLTGQQVRDIIESTAQKVRTDLYDYQITPGRPNGTWHQEMGYGLVDAYAAVLAAQCYSNLPIVQGIIAQNTTWNSPAQAKGTITIQNGATLTVTSQIECQKEVTIIVAPGGKLIIDGGTLTNACEGETWKGITIMGDYTMPMLPAYQGWLELKNGVTIENAENGIVVKGGGLTVEDNVIFQNLSGGMVLENAMSELIPYDNDIEYNLTNITFNNTPLNHSGTRLNVSHCTFNQSNVEISIGVSNINNCTFNESKFTSNGAIKTVVWHHTTVGNCSFNGNNSIEAALEINNSRILEIYNNTIHGYETGIDMNYSGATIAYYYGCRTVSAIHDNDISSCSTGIKLYNSILNLANNNIHNNIFGVRLFNKSSTSFYGWGEPTLQRQYIRDNSSYELYASSSSFPIVFLFNDVIDENNLGNSFNDPKVYWDLSVAKDAFPPSMVRDVKNNCWGENFDAIEDFYPYQFYDYDPVLCFGKSGTTGLGIDEILFQTALDYLCCEDYTGAEFVFLDLIENYPESKFAVASMYELFSLEPLINNDYYKLQNYYAAFTPLDSNLYDVADFLATRCNVMERDWQPAIDWYEFRIENPPSYQDSVFAVIDLGNIHLMMEGDTIGGAKSGSVRYRLEEIKPKTKQHYEENKATLLATLPQIKKSKNDKLIHNNDINIPKIEKKGILGQCTPNPTTGTTTISYELYTEGAVEIFIYNSIGQLVMQIPQGTQTEGAYQANVALTNMPKGIYYYALFVDGERVDTKKLIVNTH